MLSVTLNESKIMVRILVHEDLLRLIKFKKIHHFKILVQECLVTKLLNEQCLGCGIIHRVVQRRIRIMVKYISYFQRNKSH